MHSWCLFIVAYSFVLILKILSIICSCFIFSVLFFCEGLMISFFDTCPQYVLTVLGWSCAVCPQQSSQLLRRQECRRVPCLRVKIRILFLANWLTAVHAEGKKDANVRFLKTALSLGSHLLRPLGQMRSQSNSGLSFKVYTNSWSRMGILKTFFFFKLCLLKMYLYFSFTIYAQLPKISEDDR